MNALLRKFTCPACGSLDAAPDPQRAGGLLEFSALCAKCGVRARLLGVRAHAAVTAALLAAAYGCYYALGESLADNLPIACVTVVAVAFGILIGEKTSRNGLLRWHVDGIAAPRPDEISLGSSLRADWMFLIPPALFGACVMLLDWLHAPSIAIGIPFVACLGCGFLPVIHGRAPFEFAGIALFIWVASVPLSEFARHLVKLHLL